MRNKNKARPGAATPERVEGKRAIIGAAVNPTAQFTTPSPAGQRSIADLLGVGRENAITRRDLERLTGLDGRSVRLFIERERRAGIPICSDNQNGYYLPCCKSEKDAFVASMRHRAREIERVAAAVEKAGEDVIGTEKQLSASC